MYNNWNTLLLFFPAMKTEYFSQIHKAFFDLIECIEVNSDHPSDPSQLAVKRKFRLHVIYLFTFADFSYQVCCLSQNWLSKWLLCRSYCTVWSANDRVWGSVWNVTFFMELDSYRSCPSIASFLQQLCIKKPFAALGHYLITEIINNTCCVVLLCWSSNYLQ